MSGTAAVPYRVGRRGFLGGALGFGVACGAGLASAPARPALGFALGSRGFVGPVGDVLVVVVLRGGLDGLSAVVPAGDAAYWNARPRIAVRSYSGLDQHFGLHASLAPLAPIYSAGDLAIVHAVGCPGTTRSHFVKQLNLEQGTTDLSDVRSGWLARHLDTVGRAAPGAVRGAAPVPALPVTLMGTVDAVCIPDAAALAVPGIPAEQAVVLSGLSGMATGSALEEVANAARAELDALSAAAPANIPPHNGARYGKHPTSEQFRRVAQLVRAGIGVEAAVIDIGGFDTHVGMGDTDGGAMRNVLDPLGVAMAAFYTDLYDLQHQVTTIVVSEFGRRLHENGSGGTDHGNGGVFLLMGGGIRGGRVYGNWPGLAPDVLDQGDVPVTTDFRDVLAEIVVKRGANSAIDQVFPGHSPTFLELADHR